jgi:hypothetical protein
MDMGLPRLPITREKAIQVGSPRYNTSKECKNGHQADRDTISGACTECVREGTFRRRLEIKAAIAAARVKADSTTAG